MQTSFIQAETPEGPTLLNLQNVAAIVVDQNGTFGVRRRVTVHLAGGTQLTFDKEYANKLIGTLQAEGHLTVAPAHG